FGHAHDLAGLEAQRSEVRLRRRQHRCRHPDRHARHQREHCPIHHQLLGGTALQTVMRRRQEGRLRGRGVHVATLDIHGASSIASRSANRVKPPSDVIVVGAGIVGCAIAYELARRGVSVEVVDDRPIGMGATQASAGILAPFVEARDGDPLLDLAVRSLELYDDFITRVAADSGHSISYRRTGTLDVALDESHFAGLQATADVLRRRRVPATLLDAQNARAEEPLVADGVAGALLIDAHGFVAASELTRALAAAARRSGAQLLEPNRVRGIAERQGEIVVDTDKGSLTSAAVVLAAGSWSGQIAIAGTGDRVPVRPVRGQ